MSQSISVLNLSVKATATLAANRFITTGGAYPTAAANAFGVTNTEAADGELVSVAVLGTAVVSASAAIAVGAAIQVAADGEAATASTGKVVATALEAASSAGDLIEVFLIPNAS